MIYILSQLSLGLSSLIAAALLYRQPSPLTNNSKVVASLLTICCLFISSSVLLTLFIGDENNDASIFRLILANLHFFLAIPLISSILLMSSVNKEFSKAAWGRWILALLATFELCRRAEVANYYSDFIVYVSSLITVFTLFYKEFLGKKQIVLSDLLLKCIAILCYVSALVYFSKEAIFSQYTNEMIYNLLLAVALPLIYFLTGKKLQTVEDR